MAEIDAYVLKLTRKVEALEQDAHEQFALEHEHDVRSGELHGLRMAKLRTLGEELATVEAGVAQLTKRFSLVVHAFQQRIHRQEFERLRQRVENYRGVDYLTRAELSRD